MARAGPGEKLGSLKSLALAMLVPDSVAAATFITLIALATPARSARR